MRNPLSDTIVTIKPSGIRKFFDIVSEMEDAISLGVGEPDFDTPWHIRDEGIYSLEKGRTFYTSNAGLKQLREEIAHYLRRRYQVSYDPLHEIMITVGGSEAIDIALRAMVNPGDEVLIPQPSYVSYVPCTVLAGGTPVMSKTGHAFIKERMRQDDAVYGGEMSAHHYFRDFAYCDSGMIPWLLVAELVCLKGKTLGELVRDRMAAFPASGEINSKLAQPVEAINRVEQHFSREALAVDRTDGISMTFADWRFNLRSSNTEPVVRLNVESRGDVPLMEARTRTLLTLLNE